MERKQVSSCRSSDASRFRFQASHLNFSLRSFPLRPPSYCDILLIKDNSLTDILQYSAVVLQYLHLTLVLVLCFTMPRSKKNGTSGIDYLGRPTTSHGALAAAVRINCHIAYHRPFANLTPNQRFEAHKRLEQDFRDWKGTPDLAHLLNIRQCTLNRQGHNQRQTAMGHLCVEGRAERPASPTL